MQEVVRSILRRLRVVIRSGGSFVVFFCFSFPYRFCRNSCNGKCGAIDDGPARPVGPRLVREGLSRYLTFYLLSSRLDFDGHRIQTKNMRMARSTSLCDIRSSPYFWITSKQRRRWCWWLWDSTPFLVITKSHYRVLVYIKPLEWVAEYHRRFDLVRRKRTHCILTWNGLDYRLQETSNSFALLCRTYLLYGAAYFVHLSFSSPPADWRRCQLLTVCMYYPGYGSKLRLRCCTGE